MADFYYHEREDTGYGYTKDSISCMIDAKLLFVECNNNTMTVNGDYLEIVVTFGNDKCSNEIVIADMKENFIKAITIVMEFTDTIKEFISKVEKDSNKFTDKELIDYCKEVLPNYKYI